MGVETLLIYTAVAFFYIISPGPAIFLALANGMDASMKAVVASSLGNIMGLFLLSAVSIIGLGSVTLASSTLFFVVKVIGALYLVYLGLKQWQTSSQFNRPKINAVVGDVGSSSDLVLQKSQRAYFLEGFILAATNPKPILFFIAIFPQFLNPEAALVSQFFILTSIFMAISFCSLFSYGFLASSAKRLFMNETSMKWFHRITGGLFIGMGVGLMQLKSAQH